MDEYLASPTDEVRAERIAACAGLRHRIVHEYDEIDPRRVHEGLQAAVRDIPVHLRRVHDYLDSLGGA